MEVVDERRAGVRPARKKTGRTPTGACAREAGGAVSGSGRMTLPPSTLFSLFGFAARLGQTIGPRSAVPAKHRKISTCNIYVVQILCMITRDPIRIAF